MLSGKYYVLILILCISIAGCFKKETDENPQSNVFDNPEYLTSKLKEVTGEDVKFYLRGSFASDSTADIAAGTEIMNKKEWGIKFYLFKINKDSLKKVFVTNLLEGSFKESKVEKLSFPDSNHQVLYYNSMNYFMGNTGGEVLVYIIDLQAEKIYYAHLVSEPDGKVNLYISDDGNPKISKYLRDLFKKDYPSLRLTSKDPVLN